MAAPSQTSPNQASEATTTVAAVEKDAAPKEPEETSAPPTETEAPASTAAPKPQKEAAPPKNPPLEQPTEEELTYQNTQTSNAVCIAKELLKDGQFDEALETIGQEMSRITSLIGNDEQSSIHECMAPLYYLYGTTLLYSIEESTDVAAMGQEEEDLDDLQIAWENLETARHITQRMVDNATTSIPDIQLDLAQIHLRLGDLTRANGNHVQAIAEYQTCLDIRQAIFGLYHHKVSEVQFVLAQAYTMLVSEADKEDSEIQLTPQQVEEHRCKSIHYYVECTKSFAGQISDICGASPQEITTVDATKMGNTKTTGMEASEVELSSASQVIAAIRQRVQPLVANNTADANQVHDLKELLDEIQETLDEMETSKEGIQQVSHMKVMAKEAVDGGGSGNVVENADGSTTTIGFGTSTSSTASASASTFATTTTTTAAAGTASSATSAKPMMVIKKKKKRDADESNSDEKPAAVQGDCNAKRAKTSEE